MIKLKIKQAPSTSPTVSAGATNTDFKIKAKESYNINKAIQIGVVKEDTSYADYFAKTCGFENKKELLKYTKAVFELADKEK